MSVYAIGDLQGCCKPFESLLEKINFDTAKDLLYLVGDLVNRGGQSLETLHLIQSLGDSVRCVLGNHDIFLLRIAAGFDQRPASGVLDKLLDSPHFPKLIDWLYQQPLMVIDEEHQLVVVHAGLLPEWDFARAKQLADDIEKHLSHPAYRRVFLKGINSKLPDHWNAQMDQRTQRYAALNVMTRIRFCDKNSKMFLDYKGAPGTQAQDLKPWFEWPHQRDSNYTVVFGHWASLGFVSKPGLLALDTGCVWGRELTAYRLDSGSEKRFSVACQGHVARFATAD